MVEIWFYLPEDYEPQYPPCRCAQNIRHKLIRESKNSDKIMQESAFENFKKHWLEEISKIEKASIDNEGIHNIRDEFHLNKIRLFHLMSGGEFQELDILEAKLRIALETARSRYRTENPNWWDRFAEAIGRIVHRVR